MRVRGLLLLAVSLVLGLIAIGWVHGTRNSGQAPARSIVVAATALNFGDRLTPAALRTLDWPNGAIPDGAFTAIDDIAGAGQDRVVLHSIEAGEPVLAAMVSGAGQRASLSSLIDKTMRAMTIRVDDTTGVAGFVLTNDRVDVLLTREAQSKDNPQTAILLQNVKVLAINQEAGERQEKTIIVKAVTLEVTPEDAEKLALGGQIGTLSLALRHAANGDSIAIRPFSLSDLQPQPPAQIVEPLAPPAPANAKVEIFRGSAATTYDVVPEARITPRRSAPIRAPKPGSNAKNI